MHQPVQRREHAQPAGGHAEHGPPGKPLSAPSSCSLSLSLLLPSLSNHCFKKKDKNARAGIIERVYLKNFKCHALLEFDLHDRINFILGRNGSGKSAVMDAVILILGARATCTGRQASAKTFIKTNAE